MKKSLIFFISSMFISFLIFFSCNKDGLLVSSPNIPDYLVGIVEGQTCFEEGINGAIIIQSYGKIHGLPESTRCSGFFNGQNGAEDKGDLKLAGIDIQPDSDKLYQSNDDFTTLYGSTSTIQLKDNTTTYFSKDFSFPSLVKVTYPTINDEFIINNLSPNITWEEDSNNNIGVAVIIEYSPFFLANIPFSELGYDKIITHTVLAEDTGVYEFKSSDFSDIPEGGSVKVRIVRGTCDSVEDNETNGKYFIYGLSMVDVRGQYMGGLN